MKKKSTAQNGATGIRLTAFGYAMNASPGPGTQSKTCSGRSALTLMISKYTCYPVKLPRKWKDRSGVSREEKKNDGVQIRTRLGDLLHGDALLERHEAENAEDGEARVQRRAAVDGGNQHAVPVTIYIMTCE